MAWVGAAVGLVGVAGSLYSQRQNRKAAERAARGQADQQRTTTTTRSRSPWAPAEPLYRAGLDKLGPLLDRGFLTQEDMPQLQLPRYKAPDWKGPAPYENRDLQGQEVYGMLLDHSQDPYLQNMKAYLDAAYKDDYNNNPLLQRAFNTVQGSIGGLMSGQDPAVNSTLEWIRGGTGNESVFNQLLQQWTGEQQNLTPVNVVQPKNQVGAQNFLQSVLNKDMMTENPFLEGVIADVTRDMERVYDKQAGAMNLGAEGVGRHGGGAHRNAQAQGLVGLADEVGGASSQIRASDYEARMQDYMNALGLSTQWDLGQEGIAQAGNELALAKQQGTRGNILDLLGIQNQLYGIGADLAGSGGRNAVSAMGIMGDLAQGAGNWKLSAMDRILGAHGEQRSDMMGAAGAASQWNDANLRQARDKFEAGLQLSQAEWDALFRGSSAEYESEFRGLTAENEDAWRRLMTERMLPYQELGAYGDALNAFAGQFGTETTNTVETGYLGAPTYIPPTDWGAALGGGLGAASMWRQFMNYYNKPGGQSAWSPGNNQLGGFDFEGGGLT